MQGSNYLVQTKKKAYMFLENADCLWKWESRYNTEPIQCITKFITNDRQYS